MFSEKQLEQYGAVKAPDSLKAKVMKLETQKNAKIYTFPRKTVAAVAACLAVIIAIGSYFSTAVDVQLVTAPYQTAAYQRATVEERVVIKLDIAGGYEVSVSQGSFCVDGETVATVQLEGESEIEWLVPPVGENILKLVFDVKTQSLQLEKV